MTMAVQVAACARLGCVASSERRPHPAPSQAPAAAARNPSQRAGAPRQQQRGSAAAAAAAEAGPQQAAQPPARTVPTRLLSSQEAVDALYASQHEAQRSRFAAFYSSELGGIVTDPAFWVVQLDDHMVHRGHAVFDTAMLVEGHLYQLDQHLARFLTSAAKASIPLPAGMSVEQMKRTILETAAASCKLNGFVRYWLSAGRGNFSLSANSCLGSAFYCAAYTDPLPDEKLDEYLRGWRVKTSPVPPKAPFFAGLKSTGYLPNALALMDAQAEGYDCAVLVDGEGNVAEGPNMNLAALLGDGTLVVPPFDHALAGVTVRRMMELLPEAIEGGMEGIKRFEQRPLSLAEARAAAEVFFVGSSLPVQPVVWWDEEAVGDGTAGLVALQIRVMLQNDAKPRPGSDQHLAVPYGFMTGML